MWSWKGTRILIQQLIFPHGLVSFSRSSNRHRIYVYELRFSGGIKKQMRRSVEMVEQEIFEHLERVQTSTSISLAPAIDRIVGAKRPHEEVESGIILTEVPVISFVSCVFVMDVFVLASIFIYVGGVNPLHFFVK